MVDQENSQGIYEKKDLGNQDGERRIIAKDYASPAAQLEALQRSTEWQSLTPGEQSMIESSLETSFDQIKALLRDGGAVTGKGLVLLPPTQGSLFTLDRIAQGVFNKSGIFRISSAVNATRKYGLPDVATDGDEIVPLDPKTGVTLFSSGLLDRMRFVPHEGGSGHFVLDNPGRDDINKSHFIQGAVEDILKRQIDKNPVSRTKLSYKSLANGFLRQEVEANQRASDISANELTGA